MSFKVGDRVEDKEVGCMGWVVGPEFRRKGEQYDLQAVLWDDADEPSPYVARCLSAVAFQGVQTDDGRPIYGLEIRVGDRVRLPDFPSPAASVLSVTSLNWLDSEQGGPAGSCALVMLAAGVPARGYRFVVPLVPEEPASWRDRPQLFW